jgi:hypothetical protein
LKFRIHQVFNIPFRSSHRTLNNTPNIESDPLRKIDNGLNRRSAFNIIPNDPPFPNLAASYLELRLDERNEIASKKLRDCRQDQLQ